MKIEWSKGTNKKFNPNLSIFTNNAQRSLLLLLMHSFLSKHLKCLCMRSRLLLHIFFFHSQKHKQQP